MEIDMSRAGDWQAYKHFEVAGSSEYKFPDAFQAYWIRFSSRRASNATAQLSYR